MGVGVKVTPQTLYCRDQDPVPNLQEAGWPPGPVRKGLENLAPTGDSIPAPSSP